MATGRRGGKVEWFRVLDEGFWQLAGFLPDGERFVTIEEVVRIRSFTTNAELAAGQHKAAGSQQPQISPDGRLLAAIGYGGIDLWDLTTLDEPQKIRGSSNFGDFRSFALHPNGKTVAVIHGGPTLVQVYDLGTLTQVHSGAGGWARCGAWRTARTGRGRGRQRRWADRRLGRGRVTSGRLCAIEPNAVD